MFAYIVALTQIVSQKTCSVAQKSLLTATCAASAELLDFFNVRLCAFGRYICGVDHQRITDLFEDGYVKFL
jgi:endonuclease III